MLVNNKSFENKKIEFKNLNFIISFLIGSILGLISGIVGIGGGIFLSPILLLLKSEKPKIIATTASLFILMNSISGLIGQITKRAVLDQISDYWILFFAVLLGGFLGNFINLKLLSNRSLAIMTSLLVIFVAIRIGYGIFY